MYRAEIFLYERMAGWESVCTFELVVTKTNVKIIFYFYLTLSVTKLHVRVKCMKELPFKVI